MTADGTPFHGKIRVVSPTISANDRTALVYVDLAADDRLRPGMFARGEIADRHRSRVHGAARERRELRRL